MEPTLSSETSAYNNIQTPGKFPEDYTLYSHHGESLKTTIHYMFSSVVVKSVSSSDVCIEWRAVCDCHTLHGTQYTPQLETFFATTLLNI
jgi:hypothetical protein